MQNRQLPQVGFSLYHLLAAGLSYMKPAPERKAAQQAQKFWSKGEQL